jgi:hypothetical protein
LANSEVDILTVGNLEVGIFTAGNSEVDIWTVGNLEVDIFTAGKFEVDKRTQHRKKVCFLAAAGGKAGPADSRSPYSIRGPCKLYILHLRRASLSEEQAYFRKLKTTTLP